MIYRLRSSFAYAGRAPNAVTGGSKYRADGMLPEASLFYPGFSSLVVGRAHAAVQAVQRPARPSARQQKSQFGADRLDATCLFF